LVQYSFRGLKIYRFMKKLCIIVLSCLIWHTADANGPRRFWKKMNRRPQVCFAGPSRCIPRYGAQRRRLLPASAVCFSTSNGILYWSGGRFYVHRDGYFNPVLPAAGLFFYQLPPGCRRFAFRGEDYLFLNGFCFRAVPGGFRCQAAPQGVLPSDEISFNSGQRGEVLFRNQVWQERDSPEGKCYEFAGFIPD